jgi:hypothetical protein
LLVNLDGEELCLLLVAGAEDIERDSEKLIIDETIVEGEHSHEQNEVSDLA